MHKSIIYGLLIIFVLSACEDVEKLQVGETIYPVLSCDVDNKTVVLTEETANEEFDTFNWTLADFGYPSADPEYTLEMDMVGNNFQSSVTLTITTDLEFASTNETINQKLVTLGATPGEATNVEFKVTGSVHDNVFAASNLLTANITPYETIKLYPDLFVTGDHNGWGFTDNAILYSANEDNIYEGYVYMDNGESWVGFKMVEEADPSWNPDSSYGDADESGTSGNLTAETSDWIAKNIYATEGIGVYYIKANINNLTYSIYKTEWAITGDFNSWGMTGMTYDKDTDLWSITTNMTAGGFKFIANEDWSKVKGDNEMDGILDKGTDGNNIVIDSDGNYTITMDLSKALYTYTVVKNN